MPRFGLASNGVYICPVSYLTGGGLLSHPSTLTSIKLAVYFCCTILGVASTGRYPASCPVKPGLSSLRRESLVTPANREHLSYSYFITCFLSNKSHFSITQSLASILNPYTLKQLPPINSLKIELFGIRLLSTPTK